MSTDFRLRPSLALVALMAAAAGPGTALGQPVQSTTPPAGAPDPSDYWTRERMRGARPLPLPAAPGRPAPSPDVTRPGPAGPPQGAAGGKPSIEPSETQGGEPAEE
jgi:hypothetical protein